MPDSDVIEVVSDNIAPEMVIDPDVVIIGGGPVGLATAIAFRMQEINYIEEQRLQNHGYKKILILEKHEEYQRSHVLKLNHDSFKNFPANPKFATIVKEMSSTIRTNELEDILLKFAKKLDINIEYKHVTNVEEDVAKKYPSAKFIVGADGSHSIVRQQIFSDEFQFKKTYQYVVEMKYAVEGETRALSQLTENFAVHSYTKHFVTEVVGKTKDNCTPVTVRFFVDKETVDAMPDAKFKTPYKLSNPKIPDLLQKSLQAWLTGRAKMAKEKMIEDSERIGVIELPIYASKEFLAETKNNKVPVVLVGDSAFGVPFFKSLNNGLLCAGKLGSDMAKEIYQVPEESNLKGYLEFIKHLIYVEKFSANSKNLGINLLQLNATLIQMFPHYSHSKLLMLPGGKEFTRAIENQRSPSEAKNPFTENYSFALVNTYEKVMGIFSKTENNAVSTKGTLDEVSSNKKRWCKQM